MGWRGPAVRLVVACSLLLCSMEHPAGAQLNSEMCFWLCGWQEVNCILIGGTPCSLCAWDFVYGSCSLPECCLW